MQTRIDEISSGIYLVHTSIPPSMIPGGFSFNQYLVDDEEPLLFHTGSRLLFPMVREAIQKVMPLERIRYVAFSHNEQDECGSINSFLAEAKHAVAVCSAVNVMINGDAFDRPARVMRDDEVIITGKRRMRWLDTPHLPHGWESGYLFDESTSTLFCSDLFTQPGADTKALVESDILGPSEAFRKQAGDYYAHGSNTRAQFERLAALRPRTLACMHGSAWAGDGSKLLLELAGEIVKG